MAEPPRRFPPPWARRQVPGGYVIRDANGQALAHVYGRQNEAEARQAKVLTTDEARRIAANIARLPELLGRGDPQQSRISASRGASRVANKHARWFLKVPAIHDGARRPRIAEGGMGAGALASKEASQCRRPAYQCERAGTGLLGIAYLARVVDLLAGEPNIRSEVLFRNFAFLFCPPCVCISPRPCAASTSSASQH
jgi:hypothetical protein